MTADTKSNGDAAGCAGGTEAQDDAERLKLRLTADVLADWVKHGAAAMATVRAERPQDYLKLVTGLLPNRIEQKGTGLDHLTDEQVAEQFTAVLAKLGEAGIDAGPGAGAAEAAE
jgi:hypothetical protein